MKPLLVLTLLMAVLISGCNSSGGGASSIAGGDTTVPEPEIKTEWTIFIYGHADNNLTPAMMIDYQEMIASTLNSDVKVIVAIDLDDSKLEAPYGTQIYEVLGDGQSQLIKQLDEENFDDPDVFKKHLVDSLAAYPAKKRGVILWDHGGSWDGGFGGDRQNSTLKNIDSMMSISDIKSVLNSAAKQLKLPATPFDFIAFDTSLMGNIETAAEFKDLAKYYFASAEIEFGNGWDYTGALNAFSSSPTSSIVDLAPQIVSKWDEHHSGNNELDDQLRTQVAIDLKKIDSLADQMNSLLAIHKAQPVDDDIFDDVYPEEINLTEILNEMVRAHARNNPGYGISQKSETLVKPQAYRDLGQFISLLTKSSNTDISEGATSLLTFLNEEVIMARSLGDLRKDVQAGVSIESSVREDWYPKKGIYKSLVWDLKTDWSYFLEEMSTFGMMDNTPPQLYSSLENNYSPSYEYKPKVNFNTYDPDVDQVQVILQTTIDEIDYTIGVVASGFVANENYYSYEWDGNYYKLSNGTDSSLIGLGLQGSPGLNSEDEVMSLGMKIKGVLDDGLNKTEAYVIGSESPLKTIAMVKDGQIITFKVSELAGSGISFIPIVQISRFPFYVEMTPIELSDGLTELVLDKVAAQEGTFKLQTMLSDIWGNTSTASDYVYVGSPFNEGPPVE